MLNYERTTRPGAKCQAATKPPSACRSLQGVVRWPSMFTCQKLLSVMDSRFREGKSQQ
jgi:hypothetical protein